MEAFASMSEVTHLPSNEGRTPLMEAAASNFPEAVRLLLKNKATVKAIDLKDPQGMASTFVKQLGESQFFLSIYLK